MYCVVCTEFCNHVIKLTMNVFTDEDELRRYEILKEESYDILEEKEKAKNVISNALASKAHADLYLAQANLESSDREREKRINQAYRLRSEEHTSELQSRGHLVCRLLLEKKKISEKISCPTGVS